MRATTKTAILPDIIVGEHDKRRLEELAILHATHGDPVGHFLLAELNRAAVYPQDEVPPDTVTMNSRVLYRASDAESADCRTLAYPADCLATGHYVSVMAPLGVALLGLREGGLFVHAGPDGQMIRVRVGKVVYQPEAAVRARGLRTA
jgi:regulator of nucleoside diphosphate kinase